MKFSEDLFFAPAARLLALLRSRELSATELVDQFIERIESINRPLNAVITLVEERAILEAEESDKRLLGRGEIRPLEGLPVTIKDSVITQGVRSTWGMKHFENFVSQTDAPIVARLRAAGAIVIAKTNTPEMTMDYDCDNPVFGRTNNPWKLDRVPGGSSGGEAAALAAGMSPLGIGSDYRGSIRVPAAFCGVVGLKPSWGTIPLAGHMAPAPASPPPPAAMATLGPMGRYIDDLTLAYNIVKGPHPSWPYTVPSPDAHPERVDVRNVRCALFTEACEVPVAREIRDAIHAAGRALQKAGVPVDEIKPPVDEGERLWWEFQGADGGQGLHEVLGEALKHSRERLRNAFGTPGPSKSAAEFFKISFARDAWRVQLAEFMERYPIILGPVFCTTAFPHEATQLEIEGKSYAHFLAGWPAAWGNCAGVPGISVPVGRDRDGLPIAVQVNGRAFGEETVLAIAKVIEQELGGFQRPPLK
ncbi:MAG TPA: amidase [Candidatus Binataceae bacterium]|nr:amidase [Candidatus Binataceae bacterium]